MTTSSTRGSGFKEWSSSTSVPPPRGTPSCSPSTNERTRPAEGRSGLRHAQGAGRLRGRGVTALVRAGRGRDLAGAVDQLVDGEAGLAEHAGDGQATHEVLVVGGQRG